MENSQETLDETIARIQAKAERERFEMVERDRLETLPKAQAAMRAIMLAIRKFGLRPTKFGYTQVKCDIFALPEVALLEDELRDVASQAAKPERLTDASIVLQFPDDLRNREELNELFAPGKSFDEAGRPVAETYGFALTDYAIARYFADSSPSIVTFRAGNCFRFPGDTVYSGIPNITSELRAALLIHERLA